MKRRDFIKTLAASGVALNMPIISGNAHASVPEKYLIVVNAGGGWDPTSLCDPKGLNSAYEDKSSLFGGSTNSVALNPSKRFGGLQWSDIPDTGAIASADMLRIETQFDGFFGGSGYGDRLTVINGIDTATNSHDVGPRHVWSGNDEVGYPAMSAFFAAAVAPTLPMSFLSNGGYDVTASVVARARANNPSFIEEIAAPNVTYGNRDILFRSGEDDVFAMIQNAQEARLNRQLSNEPLERRRRQLSQIFGVRSDDSDLSELIVHLNDVKSNVLMADHWNAGRAENLKTQAQLVASALKANLAVSANLNMGGLDTHDNHDSRSYPVMGDILEGIHYLMVVLDYLGIREKTTVVVGSDFGRTPYYNVSNGKDHWPLTSMLVLQGSNVVTGGRVFGATSDDFNVEKINVTSGLPDTSGLVLEPAHVNQELRKLLGVADHPLAELFPLPESNFNIFV